MNRKDFQKLKLCKSQRDLLGKGKRESSLRQLEGDEHSVSGKLVLLQFPDDFPQTYVCIINHESFVQILRNVWLSGHVV